MNTILEMSGRTMLGAALMLVLLAGCNAKKTAGLLWEPATWSGKVDLPAQAAQLAQGQSNLFVKFDLLQLQSPLTKRIELPLPDGTSIFIDKTGEDHVGKTGFIWRGKVEGDDKSIATFSIVNDVLVGDVVMSSGKMYRIDHVTADVQIIFELDPSTFPAEAAPVSAAKPSVPIPEGPTSTPSCPEDSADRIDIMVVYTEAACAAAPIVNLSACTAFGKNVTEAKINQAVAETNTIYMNSGVNHRIWLVHIGSVGPYTEGQTLDLDLTRLKLSEQQGEKGKTGDPVAYLEGVLNLRDQHHADAVVLIVQPMNRYPKNAACGLSTQMSVNKKWVEKDAFSVVPVDCATGNFSFGHELGHIMGAGHDADTATQVSLIGPNRGFIKAQPSQAGVAPWRTVMAQNSGECFAANSAIGCARLPNWSNPDQLHHGDPMGSTEANNRQVLNETAGTVANFRRSSDCGGSEVSDPG